MATTAVRAPRQAMSGSVAPPRRFAISDIQSKGDSIPNRYGIHAREGWGKTSLTAYTPKPIFIQTRGETGLTTLIENNQVPETPHFPEIMSWDDLLGAIRTLLEEPHEFRTLVLDTVNGAERLCYEYVCTRDFGGEWGDKGFTGYMRGYEVSLAEWRMFLNLLDELRRTRKMIVFFLFHTRIKTFKNPEGPDYDRWSPDMHEKAWGLTLKWLDCVLFGNFETAVKTEKATSTKGKAGDSSFRILYTQQRPAFDAKNRMGLPPEIEVEGTAAQAWQNLQAAIKQATMQNKQEVA